MGALCAQSTARFSFHWAPKRCSAICFLGQIYVLFEWQITQKHCLWRLECACTHSVMALCTWECTCFMHPGVTMTWPSSAFPFLATVTRNSSSCTNCFHLFQSRNFRIVRADVPYSCAMAIRLVVAEAYFRFAGPGEIWHPRRHQRASQGGR